MTPVSTLSERPLKPSSGGAAYRKEKGKEKEKKKKEDGHGENGGSCCYTAVYMPVFKRIQASDW